MWPAAMAVQLSSHLSNFDAYKLDNCLKDFLIYSFYAFDSSFFVSLKSSGHCSIWTIEKFIEDIVL